MFENVGQKLKQFDLNASFSRAKTLTELEVRAMAKLVSDDVTPWRHRAEADLKIFMSDPLQYIKSSLKDRFGRPEAHVEAEAEARTLHPEKYYYQKKPNFLENMADWTNRQMGKLYQWSINYQDFLLEVEKRKHNFVLPQMRMEPQTKADYQYEIFQKVWSISVRKQVLEAKLQKQQETEEYFKNHMFTILGVVPKTP